MRRSPLEAPGASAPNVGRRELLAGAVMATLASSSGQALAAVDPVAPNRDLPAATAATHQLPVVDAMLTLNATEQAFITAAVDTLVPVDALSPCASECGVVVFIDRQLAGAWGGGARLYRSGPFLKGKAEHGYQLPLTPREYFAAGIAAVNGWTQHLYGRPLDALDESTRVETLKALETGKAELDDLSGSEFFEALLAITLEGFFADPIYGGNRDKAGWKMVGYPGLPATYATAIEQYRGRPYRAAPKSIADFA